jgi:hypothetical protein
MNCDILEHKSSKLNALKELFDENILTGIRILDASKNEMFENFHAEQLKQANKDYNLNLTALYETANTATRQIRVVPIEASFNLIDNRRKALGIYDNKFSFGYYNTINEEEINRKRTIERTEEQKKADAGEYVFQGEIYPSKEDMQLAIQRANMEDTFMAVSGKAVPNPTNYNDVILFKENLLKKITNKIADLRDSKKYSNTDTVRQSINELGIVEERLKNQINTLKTSPLIFKDTMTIFKNDLFQIEKLLSNTTPSIEDLTLATEMMQYFSSIADYSEENKKNNFVDTQDIDLIDEDVKTELDAITKKLKEFRGSVLKARKQYLINAIEKSQKIKSLFPNTQSQEIAENFLKDTDDIQVFSFLFGTVDESFSGQETALAQMIRKTLEESRDKNKSVAIGFIQEITGLQEKVKSRLIELGYGVSKWSILNKIGITEANYDLFYQKTPLGNKTGRLVSKFSQNWGTDLSRFIRSINADLELAFINKSPSEVSQVFINKYNWLNERVDFVEIGSLPEIISNPNFAPFASHFDIDNADQYKKDLIAKIGETEYAKMLSIQTEYLEDFKIAAQNKLNKIMAKAMVSKPSELKQNELDEYNIFVKNINPFEFLKSHKEGHQGRIEYIRGTQSNETQSQIKYNSFTPKEKIKRVDMDGVVHEISSGFYDANYDTIDKDPILKEFLETLTNATEYINSSVSDSNTSLGHNSLLRMTQDMTEVLFNKNTSALAKTSHILKETGQTIKDIFSSNDDMFSSNDESINKSAIKTIQSEVQKRFETLLQELSIEMDTPFLKGGSKIKLLKVSPGVITALEKITGLSQSEMINKFGTEITANTVKEYITNAVMEEQTFNLPVMLKAYLDIASEYKSQKEALPQINIYKHLYDKIERGKKKKKGVINKAKIKAGKLLYSGKGNIEDVRPLGKIRMQAWIDKNVKGKTKEETWGKIGAKHYTSQEKKVKAQTEAYVKYLEEKLATETEDAKKQELQNEIDDNKQELESIGKNISPGAIYNTVINKMGVLLGIGYNIPTQFVNRFQGWWSGMINDTGMYWTEGNFNVANAFVNRKGLRRLPGQDRYREEVRKVKLLVEIMGVITDNTNELDRAKTRTGLRGISKKMDPFYLVEYTEWHNQVPQILSVLMDTPIKHKTDTVDVIDPVTGQTKQVPQVIQAFDGHGLPAFEVKKGRLVLKPEYDTEENRATWEKFSSQESFDLKSKISAIIARLNGDYSKTGTLMAKSTLLGRSLMMFHTWMPKQYALRFARNQTDLNLGLKDFDGAYSGALKTKNTTVAASGLLAITGGIIALTGGGLFFGGALAAGAIANIAIQKAKSDFDGDNLQTMKQLTTAGNALCRKIIGIPVNTISGKTLIKAHSMGDLNVSPQERQNLTFMVNETAALLLLLLAKLVVKSVLWDDDDKEPKLMPDGSPNPYYYTQFQNEKYKEYYNLAENMISRMLQDSTTFLDAKALYSSVSSITALDIWFTKAGKLSDGLSRTMITDNDYVAAGPSAGESKLLSSARGLLVPGVFNELMGPDKFAFGFGKLMKQEYNKSEVVDKLFQSDYKADRISIKSKRAAMKEKMIENYEKAWQLDKAKSLIEKQDLIEEINKQVAKDMEYFYPLDIRDRYDAEQNKINVKKE